MPMTEELKDALVTGTADAIRAIDPDAEVREIFVTLIAFVAEARASSAKKNEALEAIEALQARLLP